MLGQNPPRDARCLPHFSAKSPNPRRILSTFFRDKIRPALWVMLGMLEVLVVVMVLKGCELIVGVPEVQGEAIEVTSRQSCEFEVMQGLATHVGRRYYPWEATVRLRQKWGQIKPDFQIGSGEHLAALHPDDHQYANYFGRRVWVISLETGRTAWVDVVDAMSAHLIPHAEAGQYWGRVIDLTPELFGRLLGFDDGPRDRGGQRIMVLVPLCDNYRFPAVG